MEQQPLQTASDNIEKFFDFCPVDLSGKPADTAVAAFKEGSARAYADNGFRMYLENAVKLSNKMLIRSSTPEQMLYYKARMDALMQILSFGKYNFINSEMGKKPNEKERVAQVEAELNASRTK